MIRARSLAFGCALAAAVVSWSTAVPSISYGGATHPIIMIVMENKSYDKITRVKKADAPYINGTLIPGGRLFTNYYATTSGSVKDYLAMTSALINVTAARSSDNIFNQLQNTAGATWGEYEEDMPSICYTGPNQTPYMKGHNPAVAYRDIKDNATVCNAGVLQYSSFDPAHPRSFSYVVPNEYNDMHTGSSVDAEIQAGDAWLANNVPAMVDGGAEVILTFDEGTPTNEHIVTLEFGAGVAAGTTDGTAYGHYSLLAGLEDAFGVSRINGSVGATPLPM
jgi:hypothetical protein